MKKLLFIAALAALAMPAQAEIVAQFTVPSTGGIFYFHDSRVGLCPEGLLLVEYAPPQGNIIPGCYRIDEDGDVVLRLVDSRGTYFPAKLLEQPKKS